jgi:phospholipid/cholesterol/gamma-HCH transport system permease protein
LIALILMMPLLTIYALVISIAGGAAVSVGFLGLDLWPYLDHTRSSLTLHDIASGLFKASVFGVLVAVAGCLRGIQSGRSAAAVGLAATSAVVTAIVLIIVAEGILTVIYHALGI